MNKFKVITCSFAFLFLASVTCIAQGTYEKGTINISKKKSIEAYILIDFTSPQKFQNSITYITPKDYAKFQEKGKIKGKKKIKLKPKEIQGFTLANGKVFKTVKYIDLTGKAIKMLPKRLILEQIIVGKIDMYKMYSKTSGSMPHELANVIMDSKMDGDELLIEYIQNNFQLLIQKESKNPKNVIAINLLNFIGDNETVKKNYDNNHYGLRNQFTERQKFGKYVGKKYEAAFLKMIADYNG